MRTVRRSRGRPPLCRIITNIHILIEWRKSVMKLIVINIHSQNWGSMVKSISLDKLGTQKIKLNWWSKMISLNETHSYRAYETVHYKIITFSQSDMFIMHKHDHLKQQCTSAQWKDFFFGKKWARWKDTLWFQGHCYGSRLCTYNSFLCSTERLLPPIWAPR